MNILTLNELSDLIQVLKANNITKFKCGDLELSMVNKETFKEEPKAKEKINSLFDDDSLKELYSHLPSFVPLRDEPPKF